MKLELVEEATRSRSGRHRAFAAVFLVRADGSVERVRGGERTRGTYALGEARLVRVEPPRDGYVVHVWLVLNPRGWVKGRVSVYGEEGLLYSAIIRERKLRGSKGDPRHSWAALRVLEELGVARALRRVNVEVRGGPRGDAGGGEARHGKARG